MLCHTKSSTLRLACVFLVACAVSSIGLVQARVLPSPRREACQEFTSTPNLWNCPRGTLYVSATDQKAHFTTIQSAVASLPSDASPHVILVGAGTYNEQVNVTRTGPLTILGQTSSRAAETSSNLVTITYALGASQQNINGTFVGSNIDNGLTAVLSVAPSLNASLTGAGYTGAPLITDPTRFGCVDFKMYNIDLVNTWGPSRTGPALAVSVSYARASFYGVDAKGYQDTVYAGHNASVYFLESTIRGSIDYLYGFGTLWIEKSILASRGAGGGLVAWKGSIEPAGNLYGCYISNSHLTRSSDIDPALNITGQVALGRPWNNASRVIYLNTEMDDHILPRGFIPWSSSDLRLGLLQYGEYNSIGPGAAPSQRAFFPPGTPLTIEPTNSDQIEHDLTRTQAQMFTMEKVFGGDLNWIDSSFNPKGRKTTPKHWGSRGR